MDFAGGFTLDAGGAGDVTVGTVGALYAPAELGAVVGRFVGRSSVRFRCFRGDSIDNLHVNNKVGSGAGFIPAMEVGWHQTLAAQGVLVHHPFEERFGHQNGLVVL
jgi:hypothetical protein